ncbi:hypothetical protein D1AOALGA4SA_5401 [Olavius algarvensis Delta 1 endosymbiont]|nr:hypothetical protein D1AOALGA4SA_5401 [Olavius algarvensis Delta 1 endosymbiont]
MQLQRNSKNLGFRCEVSGVREPTRWILTPETFSNLQQVVKKILLRA